MEETEFTFIINDLCGYIKKAGNFFCIDFSVVCTSNFLSGVCMEI